jgi:ABC-type spermidine/putrescine transport system permease subunit I
VQIQANFTGVGNWPLGAALSFLMLAGFLVCYALTMVGLRILRLDRIRWS